MLKKLRRKFTLINMIIVTLVLLVVFSTVIIINRNQRVNEVYDALEEAVTNDGMISIGRHPYDPTGDAQSALLPLEAGSAAASDGAAGTAASGSAAASDGAAGTASGSAASSAILSTTASANTEGSATQTTRANDSASRSDSVVPVEPPDDFHGSKYASSQFVSMACYIIDSSGAITETLNESISIDSDVLTDAISRVLSSSSESGRFSDLGLYYSYRSTPDGNKVAFASTTYVDSSTDSLVITLVCVGLATLVVFFIISIFLSRWATKPVDRAWKQQKQFVGDASHELKTPLTVIMANNSILMAHPDATVASQMQWIESSESESKIMQGLIGDLLFLAKPDNEELRLQFSDVNLSDLVESNLLQFESVAFENGIELSSNVEPNIVIPGNESRLQRLVGTLLDNACKYCNKGGSVDVTLKRGTSAGAGTHVKGSVVVFRVHNTGEAISTEDQEHIFDRFYRADKARSTSGFGLGLAIAKEVAEEHHGTISVTSTPSEGTTFSATIGTGKPER